MSRLSLSRVRIGLATLLFLFVSLNSVPEVGSDIDTDTAPPSAEELAILEGLADWAVGPRSEPRDARRRDIMAEFRGRPDSFELFRSYNEGAAGGHVRTTLPYGELIAATAERHRVDSLLLAAIVEAESSFNPGAISEDGAVGLMQVLPSTALLFGIQDPADPSANVEVGARYLTSLLKRFDGDLTLALAAYNAGPGAVARYGDVPPFKETRGYVKRVLNRYVDHHQAVWRDSGCPSGHLLECS